MPVSPNITLAGNLVDASGNPLAGGSLYVQLCSYGSQIPTVQQSGVIAQTNYIPTISGTGAYSFSLYGNDQITPAGSYYVMLVRDASNNVVQCSAFRFIGTQTVDLANVSPFNPVPPPVPSIPPWLVTIPFSALALFPAIPAGYVMYEMTLTGVVTASEIQGTYPGQIVGLTIIQDSVGNHPFALPPNALTAEPVSLAPNAITTYCFIVQQNGTLFSLEGPQGAQGIPGVPASLALGTVTTGTAGSPVVITNTGTSAAAVFNFTIPQGEPAVITNPLNAQLVANAGVSVTGGLVADIVTPANLVIGSVTEKMLAVDLFGNTVWAVIDSNGSGSLLVRGDGTVTTGTDLTVGGNLIVNGTLETATLNPTSLLIADVTEQANPTVELIPTVQAWTDSLHQLCAAALIDGSFYGCENARVDVYNEGTQDADGNAYYTQRVADGTSFGTFQIFCLVKATGAAIQLTSVSNNLRPRFSANGNVINFMSDRSGTMQVYQMSASAGYGILPAGQDFNLQSTIDHIYVTGQSLAAGHLGYPVLSSSQPYNGIMFYMGVRIDYSSGIALTSASAQLASFVPMVEGYSDGQEPPTTGQTSDGETMVSGCCNKLFSELTANDNILKQFLGSVSSWGGHDYVSIKQGTQVYMNGLAMFQAAKNLATAAGQVYRVAALCLIHGEQDQTENTPIAKYAADIAQLQQNYQTDIQAITGQTTGVPLFMSQLSEQCANTTTRQLFIAQAQFQAFLANPGRVYLTGPKYIYPYADVQHLTNVGYRWEGEYMEKAIRKTVYEGTRWKPLYPLSITIYGAVISVKFNVPVGPLVIDTTLVSPPTNVTGGMYGFEYYDNSGATPSISSVQVSSTNSSIVQITLASAPAAGAVRQLAYAYTAGSNYGGGGTSGVAPRGNLRDSDPYPSLYGNTLYNWCVHFIQNF
jgi:hypothetical protein